LLHPAARACIEAVERAHASAPAATPDAELARAVARLSDLYTTGRGDLAREQADAMHLAAKREYFLASDAPKVALALEECARRSEAFASLALRDELRVVDLGAGVGATSTGVLAWLAGERARRGRPAAVRVTLHAVELGEPAARAYEASVRAAAEACGARPSLMIEARDFRRFTPPACDLIVCQTALNELLAAQDTMHARETTQMVANWARAAPLVVIEPALRTTTRALMSLRDAMLALGGMHVVAPCLHQQACPMLAREGDWCHEARIVDPTPRVAAIDRIVRRRDERALFSFLATAPGDAAPARDARIVRLVTDTLGSRGKTERWVCRGDGAMHLMRLLDREVSAQNRAFLDAERGAVLAIEPLPANDRIAPAVAVRTENANGECD
jgi:hypothetical protein